MAPTSKKGGEGQLLLRGGATTTDIADADADADADAAEGKEEGGGKSGDCKMRGDWRR